jgi:hypothetical protein
MSLLKMLMARATPKSRERHAQLRFACAQAYESCGEMVQFVECSIGGKRGLLNVLNGCLVQLGPDQDCLLLNWASPGARSDTVSGHVCILETEDQMERFARAMGAQSDSLVSRELVMRENYHHGRAA